MVAAAEPSSTAAGAVRHGSLSLGSHSKPSIQQLLDMDKGGNESTVKVGLGCQGIEKAASSRWLSQLNGLGSVPLQEQQLCGAQIPW